MSKATLGLAFFAVFVIGALIGRVTSPAELRASSSSSSPAAVASRPERELSRDDVQRVAEALDRRAVRTEAARPVVDVGAAALAAAERVLELEREVMRLRSLVDVQQQVEKETAGTAVAFPEGHSAKGDEQALHEALSKSLKARGFDGDVTALDCSEFPCIAHGKIKGNVDGDAVQGAFDDAKRALGGNAYVSLSKFVDDQDASKTFSSFALSLFPEGLPLEEQDNMNKRLRNRKNAFVDASVGD
jgi:hypothetical protein